MSKNDEEFYRTRVKQNPQDVDSWIELGITLRLKNKLAEAEESLREALQLDQQNSMIWFELAITMGDKGEFKEAEKNYRQTLKINPSAINAWFNLAIILTQQNDLIGAKEAYNEFLQLEPQDPVAWLNLGTTYHKLENYTEAENAYRTTLDIDPSITKASLNLSIILVENNNNPTEAESVLRKALDYDPFCTILLKYLFNILKIEYYLPSIVSAAEKKSFKLGNYEAIIVSDIVSYGNIQYEHLLYLYEKGKQEPIYFVSAEKNQLALETGSPTLFLCAFEKTGHANFGLDSSLKDITNFTKAALGIIAQKFNIPIDKMPKIE